MNKEDWAALDKLFPCLICGKKLEAAAFADDCNADLVVTERYGVHGGIPFATSGAYGSRILDCSGRIHFVLCDVCILQRRHRILGNDFYDSNLKEGFHNGVELYEGWLKYVKNKEGCWEEIKEGETLVE